MLTSSIVDDTIVTSCYCCNQQLKNKAKFHLAGHNTTRTQAYVFILKVCCSLHAAVWQWQPKLVQTVQQHCLVWI